MIAGCADDDRLGQAFDAHVKSVPVRQDGAVVRGASHSMAETTQRARRFATAR